MEDPKRTEDVLERLGAMGLRFSVDNFGTGYFSLAYLKRLPIDEIKIDRSFVAAMAAHEEDEVIVRSTIDLGHNLGLSVVAEGVETRSVMERLAPFGCDVGRVTTWAVRCQPRSWRSGSSTIPPRKSPWR